MLQFCILLYPDPMVSSRSVNKNETPFPFGKFLAAHPAGNIHTIYLFEDYHRYSVPLPPPTPASGGQLHYPLENKESQMFKLKGRVSRLSRMKRNE
jgi:hypothetical protein